MPEFDDYCKELRDEIEALKGKVRLAWGEQFRHHEICANIELAYRHLEDARMRIGKAIQANNGGVSIYDKKPPEEDE